jgi:HEAT repeat protein
MMPKADPRALLEELRRPGGGLKEAFALVRAGTASVPVLLKAIEDPEPRVRGLICFALGELQVPSPEVVRALQDRLNDEDHEVRYSAVRALGSLKTIPVGVRERLEAIRQTDPSPAVRDGASEALLEITGKPPSGSRSVDDLLNDLKSTEPQRREEAVNEIGRLGLANSAEVGNEKVLRALSDRLLNDDYFQSRSSAALSLWRIGQSPPFVIDALLKALSDRHPVVQSMAGQVLGNFGPKAASALPRLKIVAADTEHPRTASIARKAIERIVGQ